MQFMLLFGKETKQNRPADDVVVDVGNVVSRKSVHDAGHVGFYY